MPEVETNDLGIRFWHRFRDLVEQEASGGVVAELGPMNDWFIPLSEFLKVWDRLDCHCTRHAFPVMLGAVDQWIARATGVYTPEEATKKTNDFLRLNGFEV